MTDRGDDNLKEINKKLQRMVEETLTKNMHLQQVEFYCTDVLASCSLFIPVIAWLNCMIKDLPMSSRYHVSWRCMFTGLTYNLLFLSTWKIKMFCKIQMFCQILLPFTCYFKSHVRKLKYFYMLYIYQFLKLIFKIWILLIIFFIFYCITISAEKCTELCVSIQNISLINKDMFFNKYEF